jgi:hypothetical protein
MKLPEPESEPAYMFSQNKSNNFMKYDSGNENALPHKINDESNVGLDVTGILHPFVEGEDI